MAEKCTRPLPPIRVPESLETQLMRMAARDERTLSEYVKLVLGHHVFGHASSLDCDLPSDKESRA